jgi:hypothetical protein
VLGATSFFSVELLTLSGPQRYSVLVIMDLCTRQVRIEGIIHEPTGRWIEQVDQGLVDGFGGMLDEKRHLIHDRSAVLTEKFGAILGASAVEVVKLPMRSPNVNPSLGREIRGIREE